MPASEAPEQALALPQNSTSRKSPGWVIHLYHACNSWLDIRLQDDSFNLELFQVFLIS